MSDEGWRGHAHGEFSIPYTRIWAKNTETESKLEFQKLMGVKKSMKRDIVLIKIKLHAQKRP